MLNPKKEQYKWHMSQALRLTIKSATRKSLYKEQSMT